MQFSSRFTIATHILLCIAMFQNDRKVTSDFLAGSVNVNPVVVRNVLRCLSSNGIVRIRPGVGGAYLAGPPENITLLDVFRAVEKEQTLFHFHQDPNPQCPVGRTIHSVMDDKIETMQSAMESVMKDITIGELLEETKQKM